VRRVTTLAGLPVLLLALAALCACAGSPGGSAEESSSRSGEYYGGSIHRNSFPETFGGGGPGRIGRPDRYRF